MKCAAAGLRDGVIVSRALPDVRDGHNPFIVVFCMLKEGSYDWNRPYRKSHIVGDVMGAFHPHGDRRLRRRGTDGPRFLSARTMVDGQGNFGSVDVIHL